MKYTLYGIPNCDTVVKTIKWLKTKNIEFRFHNYKTDGISTEKIEKWLENVPFEKILNKASTTWKELSDEQKSSVIDNQSAINVMVNHTSVIKRPIIESDKIIAVGFKEAEYEKIFI